MWFLRQYFGDKCFLFTFLASLKLLDGSNEHDNLYRTFVLNDLKKSLQKIHVFKNISEIYYSNHYNKVHI